jgi:C1A family cysteine protease
MTQLLKNIAQFGLFVFVLVSSTGCDLKPKNEDNHNNNSKNTAGAEPKANFEYPAGQRPPTGCIGDKAAYEKVLAYEQLDETVAGNSSPSSYSILQYAPQRKTQGQLGSCSAWANAYAARTISKAVATGENPDDIAFSPAFLYNQLTDCDKGIALSNALGFMKTKGVLPLREFPYNGKNCNLRPNKAEQDAAKENRIAGFTRLSTGGGYYDVDIAAIKQQITQKCPVIIAQNVPETFFQAYGKTLWEPSQSELQKPQTFSPHAMCIVGYDDNKYGGAFHIMNSWDKSWGDDGCIWVRYDDFNLFAVEAYAMHPDRNKQKISADKFEVSFALQKIENKRLGNIIALNQSKDASTGGVFHNKDELKEGDKFKIVVENSKDCYIYILSYESGEGSFTVFPYKNVSAYFGVTGTRTFPKTKSFTMEGSNDYDYMTIIASKEELNIEAINKRIDKSRATYYSQRVAEALQKDAVANQDWVSVNGTISYEGDRKNKNVIYAVFNLKKS